MIAILEVKHFFMMTDEQLLYWANNGDKDECYAASSEYRFREQNGMLERQRESK